MRRSWWRPGVDYQATLAKYTRADAVLAATAVVLGYALLFLEGWQARTSPPPNALAEIGTDLAVLAMWGALLGGVVALRRQGAGALGLGRGHLGASLRAGAIAAGLLLAVALVIGVIGRGALPTPRLAWFVWGIPYYLCIAVTEELLWRGFVTPRLSAAWRRRWLGVALGGVLFGLSHIPFHWMVSGLGLWQFLASSWWMVVIPALWHLPLTWLYAKWNSLLAPVLLHLVMNWSSFLT